MVCNWVFAIDNILAGKGFYAVEVSHCGELQYTEAELEEPLQLSLGS